MNASRTRSNRVLGALNRTHGMSKRPEFWIWIAMRARCENPNNARFRDYGGRGIKVCERWQTSFADFMKDMGPRPPGKTLDRHPDNDGDYEPGNCRWATRSEQQNNTRRNRIIRFEGVSLTLAQWTRNLGLPRGKLSKRLQLGWSLEEALFS